MVSFQCMDGWTVGHACIPADDFPVLESVDDLHRFVPAIIK
jgi:hypothetical protein